MNHTSGGTTSQLLTGGVNSRVGAARSIKVYPGDKVKAEVYAKYWDLERTAQVGDIVASLVGAFGLSGESTGEMLKAYTGLSNAGAWMTGDGRDEDEEEGPKGFVTVLLFDKDYNFVDAGWDRLDEAYTQDTDLLNNDPFDHLEVEVTVKREGYAYIFVSNEHPSPLDIHFDDFNVTYTPSNVVQYNEYYPYGLKAETSWTRQDAKGNNYLFNAGNELNEASGWYENFYRGYDPALGRMLQVDPLAGLYSSVSGYNYALNNPVLMNDPMGDRVESQLPDYIDPESYRNGYDRPSWSQTYTDASMVRIGQMSLDSYVERYSVGTGEFKDIYGYDYSQYRVDNATLSATPLRKIVIGLGLILSPKFGMDVDQIHEGRIQVEYMLGGLENTYQAFKQYFDGTGRPARIGNNTVQLLVTSKEFQFRHQRIITGKTTSMTGNFSVDLTSQAVFVGRTNINYSINCEDGNCVVSYELFANDGFWDVDFVDEKFQGTGPFAPDGLGPNLERFGGTPYPFIPVMGTSTFTNPGYK